MRVILAVILCLFITFDAVDSFFGRRRRRRWSPPPPVHCDVSAWSSWGPCSELCAVGTKTRTRRVVTQASWGGDSCPYLNDQAPCGQSNGGCAHRCSNGQCSCWSGYVASGKKCSDINECTTNNGKCDQICKNTVGSYSCSCNRGYRASGRDCLPLDCNKPSFSDCPQGSYTDQFSNVCDKVSFSCLSGTTYLRTCLLSCANHNYQLAKITQRAGEPFGKNLASVDFNSVRSSIACEVVSGSANRVEWDVARDLPNYYCRRKNDPPTDIKLSGNTLLEHASVGSVIGSLTSQDPQQGQTFTYSVQKPSVLFGCVGDKLVNRWKDPKLNGPVTLENGGLNVTIRTTDNGSPPFWLEREFHITIQDVNDPPRSLAISRSVVYENVTVGDIVGALSAVDGDEPSDAEPHSEGFTWELVDSDNRRFGLAGWNVTVAKALNHELQSYHRIAVKCSDHGQPIRSTKANFLIDVKDIKEAPIGLRLTDSEVHESSSKGAVVSHIVASDEDGDTLSFDISQSDASSLAAFRIGPVSCQGSGNQNSCQVDLILRARLDYETVNSYQLAVRANDSSGSVVGNFQIKVLNDNEKPVALNFTGSRSVQENAAGGTVVGDFLVEDPDNAGGPFQTHSCVIDSGADGSYFSITSGPILAVADGKHINYERNDQLSVQVTCTDSGTPPMSITRSFNVTVIDVNEPPANIQLSNIKVAENSPVGTPVGKISFDDPEKSRGDQSYAVSVTGFSSVPFTLGGNDGRTLMVGGNLNHETTPEVDVTVRVGDSGGLFTDATFQIQVEDANDPPTDIKLDPQEMNEESSEGVLISAIQLVDEDRDSPQCSLLDDAGGRVKVLGTNLLVGPTPTDFESMGVATKFQIKLDCSDQHGKNVQKSFEIRVLDVNESPTKLELNKNEVRENQPDTIVGQVSVTDPDIGQKHNCTVCDSRAGVPDCPPSQLFAVDSSLRLKTLDSLDFELVPNHAVLVRCSDVVSSPQTSLFIEQSFLVTVIDVNEEPVGVCDQPFAMGISASVGSVVTDLKGLDPDNLAHVNDDSSSAPSYVGRKQALSYFLESGSSSPFEIRQEQLFKNKEIATAQNFTVDIRVTDDGVIFSRNGIQLVHQQPLSAVFSCVVVVAAGNMNNKAIRLNPSWVSVKATNGTLVGVLDTVPAKPGETFTYVLQDESQLPFSIRDNKLVLTKKKITDFVVTSSGVSYVPLSITSTGSQSLPLTRSFYITVVGHDKPVQMCLLDGSVAEVAHPHSKVGQLIIEDPRATPRFSCARTGCCRDLYKVSENAFKFFCKVDTPEGNSVASQPTNVTQLLYLDSSFVLRTRVKLKASDYTQGEIRVHFSCFDLERPLHFIGQEFPVKILACNGGACPVTGSCPKCQPGGTCHESSGPGAGYTCQCAEGFRGEQCQENIDDCRGDPCQNGGTCLDDVASFECACAPEFTGKVCDRQESLCAECDSEPDTLCVKFYKAAIRCLSGEYRIPILVEESSMDAQRLYTFEQEMNSLLTANIQGDDFTGARRRRAPSAFYTEVLRTQDVADSHTLLHLTALQVSNKYNPLLAEHACAALATTSRHCVDAGERDVIEEAGVEVPPVYGAVEQGRRGNEEEESSGLGTGATAGIGVVAVIILIAVLCGGIFYYRRKYRKAREPQPRAGYQNNSDRVKFTNPVFEDNRRNGGQPLVNGAQDGGRMAQELLQDRLRKEESVRHNLDPLTVRKRNDIKVFDNDLYLDPDGAVAASQEKGAVNFPEKDECFQEDLKATKSKAKTAAAEGFEATQPKGALPKSKEAGEKVLLSKKKKNTPKPAGNAALNPDTTYEEVRPVRKRRSASRAELLTDLGSPSVSNDLYDEAGPSTPRASPDEQSNPSPDNEHIYEVVPSPMVHRQPRNREPAEGAWNDTYGWSGPPNSHA